MTETQEGRPGVGAGPRNTNAQSRYAFPESNPYAMLTGPPKLQFGDQGELTHKTIQQAGLQGEERKRAIEMLKVQAAYLEIYNSLDFPNDPDGHVVDLSGVHMTQPKVAIAWTLALLGYRPSGRAYIKKRFYESGGVYENAYYYVDSRAPDAAGEELRPEHSPDDPRLPPDTRRLAAVRDGAPGQELPTWAVKPTVTVEDAPRPQRANPLTGRPADTMDEP
jgi:hypothetical protein